MRSLICHGCTAVVASEAPIEQNGLSSVGVAGSVAVAGDVFLLFVHDVFSHAGEFDDAQPVERPGHGSAPLEARRPLLAEGGLALGEVGGTEDALVEHRPAGIGFEEPSSIEQYLSNRT